MEKSPNETGSEEASICEKCGEEYAQPLLTELHSGSTIEEYYACPRCLTKVGEVEHERVAEAREPEEEEEETSAEEATTVEVAKVEDSQQQCAYYLGYLRKREKGSPIPEGCFTCPKMIGCI